jgi:hypothetical protein
MRLSPFALALISLAGCGDDGGESINAPTVGTLEITTVTAGPQPDPDGYSISVDGTVQETIGVNATVLLPPLAPGDHEVQLGGIASTCSVTGENPLTLRVTPGETTRVTFSVTCVATGRGLDVITITEGSPTDPDGYVLTVDGKDRFRLSSNGSASLPDLPPGSHLVGLNDVAPNCLVQGENPRPGSVVVGTSRSVTFRIICSS